MFPILSGSFLLLGGISMNKIIYRPYRSQDFNPLSDIINITWGYEKLILLPLLSGCPMPICGYVWQTFTQVALDNGKHIGVIMGNNLHSTHRPLKFLIQARWDLFALSLTAEGRRARDFLRKSIKFMKSYYLRSHITMVANCLFCHTSSVSQFGNW